MLVFGKFCVKSSYFLSVWILFNVDNKELRLLTTACHPLVGRQQPHCCMRFSK